VVLHPHPAMGGDFHHPLVVAIADGLAQRGFAALRVDIGDPDIASASRELEAAAMGLVAETGLERVALIGYSWGAAVASRTKPAALCARVLIAPPVSLVEAWTHHGTPTLVLVPAHDQYGGPEAVSEAMGAWEGTTIEVVDGADHFLHGAVARVAATTAAWLSLAGSPTPPGAPR
jgi:uncharacterized protein